MSRRTISSRLGGAAITSSPAGSATTASSPTEGGARGRRLGSGGGRCGKVRRGVARRDSGEGRRGEVAERGGTAR
jgi:hypothetical protein